MGVTGDALSGLLAASNAAGPDELVPLVVEHARTLGATGVLVLVADLQQASLGPIWGTGERLSMEGTLPGRVFTSGEPLWAAGDGQPTFWLPLLDGVERLGVLGLEVDERTDEFVPRAQALAGMVAKLLVSKALYGDRIVQARRTRTMSVAAEMQWALLPPLTFGTDRVLVSGALEPAYDIGGDAFDYALNGDVLHIAVLDAMGRGLGAASLAVVAVAAYRQARRSGMTLEATVASMDEVIGARFGGDGFVTGWVGQLDCRTGHLRYVNAGHPLAQLLRGGRVVKALDGPPALPFGLTQDRVTVAEEALEPGDRLLVYTDGVVEGRREGEGFFGDQRLVEYLEHEAASGHSAPEILRRLTLAVLDFQHGELHDDSSMVLVEWLEDGPRAARDQLNAAIAEQVAG